MGFVARYSTEYKRRDAVRQKFGNEQRINEEVYDGSFGPINEAPLVSE